jgi:hypothetical protein
LDKTPTAVPMTMQINQGIVLASVSVSVLQHFDEQIAANNVHLYDSVLHLIEI